MTEKQVVDYSNIITLLEDQCAKYSNEPFIWQKEDDWVPMNWGEFRENVEYFGSALIESGQKPGEAVAILASNIKEWFISDVGAIASGAISVGLFPTSSPSQCEYMINHSNSTTVVVDSQQQLQKIIEIRSELKKVRNIVVINKDVPVDNNDNIFSWNEFIELGKSSLEKNKVDLDKIKSESTQEDIVIYVYTSGTTGHPKAAQLSNKYLLYNADSIQQIFQFRQHEKIPTFLPNNHVGGKVFDFYVSLISGRQIYLSSANDVFAHINEINPEVFGGLPRLFEKMFDKINSHIRTQPAEEQAHIKKAMAVAKEYFSYKLNDKDIPSEIKQEYDRVDSLYLKKLRELVFGKNIRIITSGAASLAKEVAELFMSIGSPIYEAYGLTEMISVSMNRPNKQRVSTVGVPMPYCNLKLAEDGEIMVSSPGMFSGYFKNEEADKEMFTADRQWMHTGDLGNIDDDGFLRIIGRKKELIITSTGKNIVPTEIENTLNTDDLINQSMLVGEGRSYCTVLLTIHPTVALRLFPELESEIGNEEFENASQGKVPAEDIMEKIVNFGPVQSYVTELIERVNQNFNRTEQVKKFKLLLRDFSVDKDEVTLTMKLKRRIILENFKEEINRLYS